VYKDDKKVVMFSFSTVENQASGWYDDKNDCIYISESLSEIDRETVYFHEKKHRECCLGECFCWKKKTDYHAEYHAMKYELEECVKSGIEYVERYKYCFEKTLLEYGNDQMVWGAHYKAAKRVKKLKLYRDAIELCRTHAQKNPPLVVQSSEKSSVEQSLTSTSAKLRPVSRLLAWVKKTLLTFLE
jgi:hypothetical protein